MAYLAPNFDYSTKQLKVTDTVINRTGTGGNTAFLGKLANYDKFQQKNGHTESVKIKIIKDSRSSIAFGVVSNNKADINKYTVFVFVYVGRLLV